jgi:hypothetical protein
MCLKEIFSKGHVSKHLPEIFTIWNGSDKTVLLGRSKRTELLELNGIYQLKMYFYEDTWHFDPQEGSSSFIWNIVFIYLDMKVMQYAYIVYWAQKWIV